MHQFWVRQGGETMAVTRWMLPCPPDTCPACPAATCPACPPACPACPTPLKVKGSQSLSFLSFKLCSKDLQMKKGVDFVTLDSLFQLLNNKSLCICCKCFETSYFGRIPFSSFWSRELGNFHSSRLLWWQPNDVQPTNKNFTTVTKVYCTTASITSCISFNHQCANTPGTGWLNVQDSGIGNPRYQRISMLAKTPNICCFVAKLHLSQFNWFSAIDNNSNRLSNAVESIEQNGDYDTRDDDAQGGGSKAKV